MHKGKVTRGIALAVMLASAAYAPGILAQTLTVVEGDFGQEKFDPTQLSDTPAAVLAEPFLDRLVQIDDNAYVGDVAERWEQAADQLSWTFFIRKGIKFQNGDDLTAADVKFSIDRYLSSDSLRAGEWGRQVDHVEVVDPYTVKVFTKGPQPYLLDQFLPGRVSGGFVLPKNYIETNGWDYFNQNPIGSGPYKVVEHIPGDSVHYQTWDGYWGAKPAFSDYRLLLVPEAATRKAMLTTGQADMAVIDANSAAEFEAKGFQIQGGDNTQVSLQFIGTQMPAAAGTPIADPRVREALSLAINRDEIINGFFKGKAKVAMPVGVAPWFPGYDEAFWTSYTADKYKFDIEKAKQLLADAGYANGFEVELILTAPSGAAMAWKPGLGQLLASYWEPLGVKTTLTTMDFGAFDPVRNVAKSDRMIGRLYMADNSIKANPAATLAVPYATTVDQNLFWNGTDSAFPDITAELLQLYTNTDGALAKDAALKADAANIMMPLVTLQSLIAVGPKVDVTFHFPDVAPSQVAAQAKPKG